MSPKTIYNARDLRVTESSEPTREVLVGEIGSSSHTSYRVSPSALKSTLANVDRAQFGMQVGMSKLSVSPVNAWFQRVKGEAGKDRAFEPYGKSNPSSH